MHYSLSSSLSINEASIASLLFSNTPSSVILIPVEMLSKYLYILVASLSVKSEVFALTALAGISVIISLPFSSIVNSTATVFSIDMLKIKLPKL